MAEKNFLLEALEKPFLSRPEENIELSSIPREEDIQQNLEDVIPTGFFDTGDGNLFSANAGKKQKTILEQNKLIETYRMISQSPEVADAVNEIVDEAIFSPGSKDTLKIDFDGEIPDSVKEKIISELKDITLQINLDKNIYSMFSTFYIDGQLNIHCAYNPDDLGGGIQKIRLLNPMNLQFNFTKDKWEYVEMLAGDNSYGNIDDKNKQFDREEVIRVDSGIYSGNLILSNLHQAIKTANILNTLEDMLVPMRFTRSVSRRVFNVDVSKLNNKKAEEVMQKNQAKFKYKKFYDLESGTISNQQHVTSLTEDYWFPNRGGEKGTTVDTIDETGNLGELGDILYFKRKLYTSLKVPTNRLNVEGPAEGEFDYDASSINREEVKFFNFISRLRNQFLEVFYELLKRQIIAKGIATEEEGGELLKNMSINFTSENKFFEKMERERIVESLNLFNDIEDLIGKYFSYEYVYKNVLKFSDDEIMEMNKQLENEKKDPLYTRFYNNDDDDDSSGW
jgi:hypothetical protein